MTGPAARHPMVKEFAWMAAVVYHQALSRSAFGWTRLSSEGRRSGFFGAVFQKPNGRGIDYVVTYRGTDSARDWLANAGFSGLPSIALLAQRKTAMELVTIARGYAQGSGDRLYLSGHSLGGGLAQMTAVAAGLPAVTFCAPAVTADLLTAGMAFFNALSNKPKIVNFRVVGDPIALTDTFGHMVGDTRMIQTERSGLDAHDMLELAKDLSRRRTDIGGAEPWIVGS